MVRGIQNKNSIDVECFLCHEPWQLASGLYDPFRVGSYFGLYCYKYSTPMGSWMQVSNMFTVLNK
jgi:hypothetical protein